MMAQVIQETRPLGDSPEFVSRPLLPSAFPDTNLIPKERDQANATRVTGCVGVPRVLVHTCFHSASTLSPYCVPGLC